MAPPRSCRQQSNNGADLLNRQRQVGRNLLVGQAQHEVARGQQLVIAVAIIAEFRLGPMLGSVEFHDDAMRATEQIDARSRAPGSDRHRGVAGE